MLYIIVEGGDRVVEASGGDGAGMAINSDRTLWGGDDNIDVAMNGSFIPVSVSVGLGAIVDGGGGRSFGGSVGGNVGVSGSGSGSGGGGGGGGVSVGGGVGGSVDAGSCVDAGKSVGSGSGNVCVVCKSGDCGGTPSRAVWNNIRDDAAVDDVAAAL